MTITIELDANDITLILSDAKKEIGRDFWHGEYSLSEQLLVRIDELLRRCGVDKSDVERIEPIISSTSGVTSARIVQTVAAAWEAARK